MSYLLQTLKKTSWYQVYEESNKGDFCVWCLVGMVVGVAMLSLVFIL